MAWRTISLVKHFQFTAASAGRTLKESLPLIDDLDKRGYIDGGCKELYMDFRNPQTVAGATTRAEITEDQCRQQLEKILTCIKEGCHSECSSLVAADRLKQLLDEHKQTIEKSNGRTALSHDIMAIEQGLTRDLFLGIINEFNRYKEQVFQHVKFNDRIDNPISRHKPEFIQLRPFMFLFRDEFVRRDWQQAACFAWCKDIVRMSQAEEFSKEDIDQLLYLKEMAPTVPDPDIKPFLQSALANLLRFVKQDAKQENDTSISPDAEKITALRSWALDLDDLETDRFTSATPRPDHPEEWTPQTGQGPNKDDRSSP